jgi:hypothetical protein
MPREEAYDPSPSKVKDKAKSAGGGPPKDDWFFINEQGTWVIKKDGAGGSALYIELNGTLHEHTLVFVSEGVILSSPTEKHHGWTYQCAGAKLWFFFSDTPLYSNGRLTYYPLYYRDRMLYPNRKAEFKRFTTASWTLGVKRP